MEIVYVYFIELCVCSVSFNDVCPIMIWKLAFCSHVHNTSMAASYY